MSGQSGRHLSIKRARSTPRRGRYSPASSKIDGRLREVAVAIPDRTPGCGRLLRTRKPRTCPPKNIKRAIRRGKGEELV